MSDGNATRTVLREPSVMTEYDEDSFEPRPIGVGWDITSGCKVSFSTADDNDVLHVNVSLFGKQHGGPIRVVTREQVASFGRMLVEHFGEPVTVEELPEAVSDVLDRWCSVGIETPGCTCKHNTLGLDFHDVDACEWAGRQWKREAQGLVARARNAAERLAQHLADETSAQAANDRLRSENDRLATLVDEARSEARGANASLREQLDEARMEWKRADTEVTRLSRELDEIRRFALNELGYHRITLPEPKTMRVLTDLIVKHEKNADALTETLGKVRAERDRLRADLDVVVSAIGGLRQILAGIDRHNASKVQAAQASRRWFPGDPEPAIGTTVSTGKFTYTRRTDGSWHCNSCECGIPLDCDSSPHYTWESMTYYSMHVPLVEVVSSDG